MLNADAAHVVDGDGVGGSSPPPQTMKKDRK